MLVNLTPHAIVLRAADGSDCVVPPSGSVARVATTPGVESGHIGGVPVYTAPVMGEVEGLPEATMGVTYIVSAMVAAAVPGRDDVVSPGTGPADNPVRDRAGRILAVTRLISAWKPK